MTIQELYKKFVNHEERKGTKNVIFFLKRKPGCFKNWETIPEPEKDTEEVIDFATDVNPLNTKIIVVYILTVFMRQEN